MKEKRCRDCDILKPLNEYYKHKQMFDGHLNKCKDCVKKRVGIHRVDNIEKIQEYDRNRPNAKERNIKQLERVKNLTDEKKKQYKSTKEKWENIGFNKNKKNVNTYLDNAVRDGRVIKLKYCEHCKITNVPIQGHHPSYLKPLNVIWLCVPCHNEEHKRLNKIERNKDFDLS